MRSKNEQNNIAFNDHGTPYSLEFNDVYFSNENGLKESKYVFIEGNNLLHHWQKNRHIHIAETGFGTGLNFFATWLTMLEVIKTHEQSLSLTFTSFEKFPLNKQNLTSALNCWPEIKTQAEQLFPLYPEVLTEDIQLTFVNKICRYSANITLNIKVGDVNERIKQLTNDINVTNKTPPINVWYLDGFSPSKNPDMWTQSLFEKIAQCCHYEATLATFTAAGFVRRGLIDAGFTMNKRKGFGRKREMLIGNINKSPVTMKLQNHSNEV